MAAPQLAMLPQPPFQLSLRIRHPSMDPAEISKELRIEPEHSFRAGQPRHSKSGLAPAAVHAESYWLAPLNGASWFGNPSIAEFAEPFKLAVTREHIDAGEISLLVTLSSAAVNSFSLPPQVNRMFGELGITLEFEIIDD